MINDNTAQWRIKKVGAFPTPNMQGATDSADGKAGTVPSPKIADRSKVLRGDGTWGNAPVADALNDTLSITEGGTSATTASEACANIGALPLNGGVMTGRIISSGTHARTIILRDDTTSGISIYGGNTYEKGAVIALKGVDNTEIEGEEGGFYISSTDGTNKHWLAGKKDGSLYWDGQYVLTGGASSIGGSTINRPARIVETYRNGYNWYRVYSDGWVEQGGRCALNSTWTIQTFLKAFAYTDYTIIAQPINALESEGFLNPVSIARRSNTQFDSMIINGKDSWIGSWYACGLGVI